MKKAIKMRCPLCNHSIPAPRCRRCQKQFVPTKPRQVYCSQGCLDAMQRAHKLAWWNSTGKALRESLRAARLKAKI